MADKLLYYYCCRFCQIYCVKFILCYWMINSFNIFNCAPVKCDSGVIKTKQRELSCILIWYMSLHDIFRQPLLNCYYYCVLVAINTSLENPVPSPFLVLLPAVFGGPPRLQWLSFVQRSPRVQLLLHHRLQLQLNIWYFRIWSLRDQQRRRGYGRLV